MQSLIVVSNRLPVTVDRTIEKSSGGLVSALEGLGELDAAVQTLRLELGPGEHLAVVEQSAPAVGAVGAQHEPPARGLGVGGGHDRGGPVGAAQASVAYGFGDLAVLLSPRA